MQSHTADNNPEELLDVFKAAALSVTKLFKTSTAAQSKARVDGYQDCLEDLLTVLDKGDVDVRAIRRWILERLDGRESILQTIESEDDVDKAENGSSPEPNNASGNGVITGGHIPTNANNDTPMRTITEGEMETESETPTPVKKRAIAAPQASATSTAGVSTSPSVSSASTKKSRKAKAKGATEVASTATATEMAAPVQNEPVDVSTPTPEGGFTFRSQVAYPTESFLELANLDLSDRRSMSGSVKDASEPPSLSSAPSSTQTPGATFIFNAPANTLDTSNASTPTSHTSTSRQFRVRHGTARATGRNILTARYNRNTAGQKRKLNFDEIFDVASLGYGKDVFSRGGNKRSRQT